MSGTTQLSTGRINAADAITVEQVETGETPRSRDYQAARQADRPSSMRFPDAAASITQLFARATPRAQLHRADAFRRTEAANSRNPSHGGWRV
jgi:hypothetical protein